MEVPEVPVAVRHKEGVREHVEGHDRGRVEHEVPLQARKVEGEQHQPPVWYLSPEQRETPTYYLAPLLGQPVATYYYLVEPVPQLRREPPLHLDFLCPLSEVGCLCPFEFLECTRSNRLGIK